MQSRVILFDTLGKETRMLVMENGEPVEFAIETVERERLTGNIYMGRVVKTLHGMGAAFVDIGLEKNAFLPLDDMPPAARDADVAPVAMKNLVQGQEILVQVVREPGGDKGPRVSMNPSFPGKYAVLLPTVQAVGVSRHIQDESCRSALEALGHAVRPKGMGVILRTAAGEASEDEIAADIENLCKRWNAFADTAMMRKAPVLLHREDDLTQTVARDLSGEVRRGSFEDALETKLAKLLRRKVWLDSGAYLVVDTCEAMTVIDVNSGKYTGKKNLPETILRLNCEAAREAARQIRLRDMGGIIVIDFVDMETDEDRRSVLEIFMQTLEPDRAKRHVYGFTAAGLLEITRRPVYGPVDASIRTRCSCCGGEGTVNTATTRAHGILRTIRRQRASGNLSALTITARADEIHALEEIGIPEDVTFVLQKGETNEAY